MATTPDSFDSPATDAERRALDAEEMAMSDQARQPALGALSDRDLSDLVTRLRSRRNRARDMADRQGREARSKAAPAGATPASGNAGTRSKHDYLNAALTRAMAEREGRGAGDAADDAEAAPSQHDLATRAMALKAEGQAEPNAMMEDGGGLHPHDPDASTGKAGLEATVRKTAPSGALDHAGELPSRERSRTRY
ncbi:MAG: hypothetical protein ACK4L4_10630 [Gemmobacter sp.]